MLIFLVSEGPLNFRSSLNQTSISGRTKSTQPRMVDLFVCSFVFVDRTHVPCHRSTGFILDADAEPYADYQSQYQFDAVVQWNIFVLFFAHIFHPNSVHVSGEWYAPRQKCALATFVTHLFTKKHALNSSNMYENSYSISRQAHIWMMANR